MAKYSDDTRTLNDIIRQRAAELGIIESPGRIGEKDDLGKMAVLELLHIAEHGLPRGYESFQDFLYDFYSDLTWDSDGQIKDIQTIIADPRFAETIVPAIKRDWDFDLAAEFEQALQPESDND